MFISSHRPVCSFKKECMEDTLEQLLKGCSLNDDSDNEKDYKKSTNIKYYKSNTIKSSSDEKLKDENNKERKTLVKNGIVYSFKPRKKTISQNSDHSINELKNEIKLDLNSSKSEKLKVESEKLNTDSIDTEIEKLISNISLSDTVKKTPVKKVEQKDVTKNPPKNIFVLVKRGPDRVKHIDIRHNPVPYEKQHINRKSLSGGVVVLKPQEDFISTIQSQLIPSTLDTQEFYNLPNLENYQEDYTETDILNSIFEKYPDILQSLESDANGNQEVETIFQIPDIQLPYYEHSPISVSTQESKDSTPSPQIPMSSPSFYDSNSPQYVQYSPNVGYNPPSVEVVNSNNAENYMYEHGANLSRLSFSKSPESVYNQNDVGGSSTDLFKSVSAENSFNLGSEPQTSLFQNIFQNEYYNQYPSVDLTTDNEIPGKSTEKVMNNSVSTVPQINYSLSPHVKSTFTNYQKIASKIMYDCCGKLETKSSCEILAQKFSSLPTEMQVAILKRVTKETDLSSCLDGLLSTWNEDQTNRLPQVETLYLVSKQLLLDEKQRTKFIEVYPNGLTLLDRAIKVCYRTPIVVKFLTECMVKVLNESSEVSSFEIDQLDSFGNRMIHRAVMRGTNCCDAIAALFSLKNVVFQLNELNIDGYSPLHLACSIHNTNSANSQCPCSYMVHVLIRHGGADVNLKDGRAGETPLHMAVNSSTCGLELVNSLLKLGANPNTANYSGATPLSLAETLSRSQPKDHYTKEILANMKSWNTKSTG